MKLLLRWLITAIALVAAANLVPGIEIRDQSGWVAVLLMAVALGLVNAFIRPLLVLLSCPLVLLTLGLFLLVVNALCLWLASWLATVLFGAGFVVDGFWPAFFGSIVVSIVSFLLSLFIPDDKEEREQVTYG
ncbi:MAG: phage holin family protein [Chloroflexaceae bacterium]|nr:phage holin family protein [Chloroflexaceae bacterium]